MKDNERDLSDFIDSLNADKKPNEPSSPELERIFDTVRQVRSLREPTQPDADYSKQLVSNVKEQITLRNTRNNRKWFLGSGAIAAVFAMFILANFLLPFGGTNFAYAMEKAYQSVKAYHGFLEIVETNGEGKRYVQAKLEIWADKEGRYYVKQQEGSQKGLITVNNGHQKWQVQPEQDQVHIFPAFPDPYRFTFELGKEIEEVKNALHTKELGNDIVAGRAAVIIEVTPAGGNPYKIWVDKETKLPVQKQYAMQNALQYKITYTKIDQIDTVPAELITYNIPNGFKEINTNSEQFLNNMEEAKDIVGFLPKAVKNLPEGYFRDSIAVEAGNKIVKSYYSTKNKAHKVVVLQNKAVNKFKPASNAVLGKVNNSIAEIQSPIQEGAGVLRGGGPYAGVTDISSIRWQQDGYEYAVVGNSSLEDLTLFIKGLTNGSVELALRNEQPSFTPQVKVPVDLQAEKGDQKNADAGHSPWKLDPAFVAQVFVSLKISPQGIEGEYPIKTEELKIVQNTGTQAIVEIKADSTPIRRVFLKRLVRQDATGIWTVVGYDPVLR